MRVGVPKEIKDHEDRVGLVPSSVAELVHHGHEVLIERGAGQGAGLGDDQYLAAGAQIAADAAEIFSSSELIVKVKEPLAPERKRLRAGQVLFTYLHLAPDPEQTHDLLKSGVTAIAYETVTSPFSTLPLLTPMSEIAGRLAPQPAHPPGTRLGPGHIKRGTRRVHAHDVDATACEKAGEGACAAPDVEGTAGPELLGDRRVHHQVAAVRIERIVDPGQPRFLEQRIRHDGTPQGARC